MRSVLEEIEEKTEMKTSSTSSAVTGKGKTEQIFLKKCDPPKFSDYILSQNVSNILQHLSKVPK